MADFYFFFMFTQVIYTRDHHDYAGYLKLEVFAESAVAHKK